MPLFSRREAILTTLLGAGHVGLRALATGLPAAFFVNPRRALAAVEAGASAPAASPAQYIIFNTSGDGDPINASVPGTYEDPKICHSRFPQMAPRPLTLGGRTFTAAAPWSTLPARVLERTVFWHLMTDTPVHSHEPEVLQLMGATPGKEMLPSLLAAELAPRLGTIQPQPISVGALTPSESLRFGGAALPVVPPLALKATLTSPLGPLRGLQSLRDQTLASLYDLYKHEATGAQRRYIDALATSQRQAREIELDLLNALASIRDNGPAAQVLAAITLVRMKVSPVVAIHIPFGGDNHRDIDLEIETTETVSGVATLASLMDQLHTAKLADDVSFMTLNVFGRTLGPSHIHGRHHNHNHQVSITIGRPFRGGVIGGVTALRSDYGALPIDSKTGAGSGEGDIKPADALAAFGQTMLAAIGAEPSRIKSPNGSGKVIAAALA